jgi:exodeoxyribonuclease V alpha subunit
MHFFQEKIMNNLFESLEQSELPYLSKAFAKFLSEQSKKESSVVLLAAAFVNYELSNGEVYLDLNAFFKAEEQFNEIDITPFKSYFDKDWQTAFSTSQVITTGEGNSPLVWDKTHHRLYLRRYWEYQKTVDDAIEKRIKSVREDLPDEITTQLNALFLPKKGETIQIPDWQKIACAIALCSKFSIITGGPGTGKTTTVTKLLALSVSLLQSEKEEKGDDSKPEILLAAPTGKAANRVSESIRKALVSLEIPEEIKALIPTKAKTIHRLLGSRVDTRLYKHNRQNKLNADIVIIDEASMVDLEMMAALLEALPENTQLILLGDKDQLSSVEPGYVFGNLCSGSENICYNDDTIAWIQKYAHENVISTEKEKSPINQQTTVLRHSYRFDKNSGIGKLAEIFNTDFKSAIETISKDDIFDKHDDLKKITNFKQLKAAVLFEKTEEKQPASYADYNKEIQNRGNYSTPDEWAENVLKAFDKFRILCAIHESPLGTDALNNKVQDWLFPDEKNTWFEGRPVMITKNDYSLGLMNGDIGIALKKEDNLKVAFLNNDDSPEKIRWFSTSRISDVQTAFALTVHKSQGSEFNHTLFVLPSPEVSVLSKELVYTAITRAISHFTLFDLKTSQGETMKNDSPTNENTDVSDDAWIDELLAWAYKNDISKEQLPSNKEDLLDLTELDLSNCELSTLPESIGNLTNLTELYLSNNQISTLPESIGNLTNLDVLYLGGNELSTLPESFGDLTDLTVLGLSSNEFSTLPDSIGKLTNLTELDLSNNQLETLPESIGNLTNLTELDLGVNQLSTLPESFGDLTDLQNLDLSNNKIDIDNIPSVVKRVLRSADVVGLKIPPLKTTLVWRESYTSIRGFSAELTEEEAELFEEDEERFFREVRYSRNQNLEWENDGDYDTYDFELE